MKLIFIAVCAASLSVASCGLNFNLNLQPLNSNQIEAYAQLKLLFAKLNSRP